MLKYKQIWHGIKPTNDCIISTLQTKKLIRKLIKIKSIKEHNLLASKY